MRIGRLSGVIVVDKDIILHGYLNIDPDKRRICKSILEDAFNGEFTPVLINHILYELLHDLKTVYKVDDEAVEVILGGLIYSEKWVKIDYRSSTVYRAREIQEKYGFSTSTSLIIATMEEHGLKRILTVRKEFVIYPEIEALDPFTDLKKEGEG